jgi:hypothetical protein
MITVLSVCLCIPPIVARQCFGEYVPAATNTHAAMEELFDASFSVRSVSYKRKAGEYFPELLV